MSFLQKSFLAQVILFRFVTHACRNSLTGSHDVFIVVIRGNQGKDKGEDSFFYIHRGVKRNKMKDYLQAYLCVL